MYVAYVDKQSTTESMHELLSEQAGIVPKEHEIEHLLAKSDPAAHRYMAD